MHLDAIEEELRTLLADLKLRTTLERAERIGCLLDAAPLAVPLSVVTYFFTSRFKVISTNREPASDLKLLGRSLASLASCGIQSFHRSPSSS